MEGAHVVFATAHNTFYKNVSLRSVSASLHYIYIYMTYVFTKQYIHGYVNVDKIAQCNIKKDVLITIVQVYHIKEIHEAILINCLSSLISVMYNNAWCT